jgi:hypothetical protein
MHINGKKRFTSVKIFNILIEGKKILPILRERRLCTNGFNKFNPLCNAKEIVTHPPIGSAEICPFGMIRF